MCMPAQLGISPITEMNTYCLRTKIDKNNYIYVQAGAGTRGIVSQKMNSKKPRIKH